jgi:hypothetical protein
MAKAPCVAWATDPAKQFRFISTELPVETKRLCLWVELPASKRRAFTSEFFVFISTHCYAFSVGSFNERTLGRNGCISCYLQIPRHPGHRSRNQGGDCNFPTCNYPLFLKAPRHRNILRCRFPALYPQRARISHHHKSSKR